MTLVDQIKAVQAKLGVTADGNAGPLTWGAIYARICGEGERPTSNVQRPTSNETDGPPVDARSEGVIATLHPKVRPLARALVTTAAAHGITIIVTSGLRTYAEQQALFDKHNGTTRAPAGHSNHNFGLAFDVTIFRDGQPVWESPLYKSVGAMGRALGLAWGGDWQSIADEPHFELRPAWAANLSEGQMLAKLRRRHDAQEDAFAA